MGLRQRPTSKSSKSTSNGCLATFIVIFAISLSIVFRCSKEKHETAVGKEKIADSAVFEKAQNDLLMMEAGDLATLHSQVFGTFEEYSTIREFSLDELSEIYQYLAIERWNSYGLNEPRETAYYKEAAEVLNIPVSKLEAADRYYYHIILNELDTVAKKICVTHPSIIPDYYSTIQSTAYCGLHTFIGSISIHGQKSNTDFKLKAKEIADDFIHDLPEWVTGVKLYGTWYKDTILETDGSADMGFLWRRGEEIQTMRASGTGYPGSIPTRCEQWGSDPWNNLKYLHHPKYTHINPKLTTSKP